MTGNENTISNLTASQRRLKALVIFLGVLLVAGLAALVVGFVVKMGAKATGKPYLVDLGVEPGAAVVYTELQDQRLLLRLRSGNDEEIVILDAATGRVIGRVHLKPGLKPQP